MKHSQCALRVRLFAMQKFTFADGALTARPVRAAVHCMLNLQESSARGLVDARVTVGHEARCRPGQPVRSSTKSQMVVNARRAGTSGSPAISAWATATQRARSARAASIAG
jgi:hypothetical protein